MKEIPTWHERAMAHPDHQTGMVSEEMLRARMGEEIADLRAEVERLRGALREATLAAHGCAQNERLRAERDALKTAAREFLTTLGAAMKTGKFHMNGSADLCHFVRQAMQKLDVLAFDREERRPVGLERLHEEAKP